MRVKFEAQLERLNVELITMGALCEEVISGAAKALLDGDSGLRETVLAAERDINQKERDIESLCMKLLLQQQPVARDLRTISSALKMISDMERIGDQAADIAEITRDIADNSIKDLVPIGDMARATIKMVTDSVDSFVRKDLGLAEAVISSDDVVDDLFLQVREELIRRIGMGDSGEVCIDLLMIASMDRLSYDKEEVKAFLAEMDLNGISIFNVGSNTVTLASGWDLMAFIRQMISPENGGDAQ